MHVGDIQTVSLKLQSNGVYVKSIEMDWLRYLGFSEKELEAGEIALVFKAEISEHKKFRFIGFGKPEQDDKKEAIKKQKKQDALDMIE